MRIQIDTHNEDPRIPDEDLVDPQNEMQDEVSNEESRGGLKNQIEEDDSNFYEDDLLHVKITETQ